MREQNQDSRFGQGTMRRNTDFVTAVPHHILNGSSEELEPDFQARFADEGFVL